MCESPFEGMAVPYAKQLRAPGVSDIARRLMSNCVKAIHEANNKLLKEAIITDFPIEKDSYVQAVKKVKFYLQDRGFYVHTVILENGTHTDLIINWRECGPKIDDYINK